MAYPIDEGQTYVDVNLTDVRGDNQADGLNHATRHNKVQDEITALKNKVGIDGDTDVNSLDYKVANKQNILSEGAFVNGDKTKLDGIEAGATADLTGAEIKVLYEGEADTNAFTDAEKTKLTGIASGAEVNVNADWNASSGDAQILNKPSIPNELTDLDTTVTGTQLNDLKTKVDGIEAGATADQTDSEIETAINNQLAGTVVGTSDTQTLTNKTIDGDSNTLSNLDIGNEVDWASATDVTDASSFGSGDKVLIFEAGVGLRKVDFDNLPGGALADGDKGDITVSSLGATWTVDNDAISNAKLANMAGHTVKAKIDGSSGDPTDLAVGSHGIVGRNSGDIISIDAGTNSVLRRNTGDTLQFGKIGSNHLETEVTDSLDLADSALQSGDIGVSIQAYDSNLGTQIMTLRCDRLTAYDDDNTVKVGDGVEYLPIPASMNGMNLISAHAYVITAGTTNTTDIQIHNLTDNVDMLSTKITIDSGETSSRTAAVAPVIDTANDDVATGNILRIDVDAVSTTAPKDLYVQLEFKKP